MKKTDLGELRRVVEQVRQETHPTLDGDFLAEVIKVEEMNPDDDEAALRAIQLTLANLLERKA